MKKKFIIFLLSLLTVNLDMAYSKAKPVSVLELKSPEIGNILSKISESRRFDRGKEVFVINMKKCGESFEFRIALIRKDDFEWILRDTKDTLRGYTEVNNTGLVVFGDLSSSFFSISSDSIEYDWLEASPPISPEKKLQKPYKPERIGYEPTVWIYKSQKGELNFYIQCKCYIFRWKDHKWSDW